MGLSANLQPISQLVRLHALGYTAHWPLTAVATTAPPEGSVLWCIVLVCLSFNVYGYIQNDIQDLDIDRLDPGRRRHPLISGRYSLRAARRVMYGQLPIMLLIQMSFGFHWQALVWLVLAIACISLYNLSSKRTALPLLTDATLGLSGSFLSLYGAALVGSPTPATLVLAASSFVYFLLINAFNNNLRDLSYEAPAGRVNSATMLGAKVTQAGEVDIGTRLRGYGTALQLLLVSLAWIMCVALGAPPSIMALVSALNLAVLIIFWLFATQADPIFSIMLRVHFFVLPLPVMAACLPRFTQQLFLVLVAVYVGPLLLLLLTRGAWRIDISARRQQKS